MNWKNLLLLFTILAMFCGTANAQSKKRAKVKPSANTQTEKVNEAINQDTILDTTNNFVPTYKSIQDTLVVKYILSGYSMDNKLYLTTSNEYDTLDFEMKHTILERVANSFEGYDVMLFTGGQKRELWMQEGNGVKLIEKWNNDSLQLENYMPLELKKDGTMKIFYYIGGAFNGGDNYSSGRLNLRAGTYLFKSIVDASITTNIGYNKSGEQSQFAGDIGIDSRAYPPFLRIPKINLSPYAGAGVSWVMPPMNYFELRLLVGAAWFVGPGSLDVGTQYGTKTGLSFSIGYTFRPSFNKGNP